MKNVLLAVMLLALLGAGITGRLGLHGHQEPSLPAAIWPRIEIALIVSGATARWYRSPSRRRTAAGLC